MDPLKRLREVDSQIPNSRAWEGTLGSFWMELDFQQNPSGRNCWGAQCYDSSGEQLASLTGDTLRNVFEDLRAAVQKCLTQRIEQLFKQQEAFEKATEGVLRRPSLFERLNDEYFGDSRSGGFNNGPGSPSRDGGVFSLSKYSADLQGQEIPTKYGL